MDDEAIEHDDNMIMNKTPDLIFFARACGACLCYVRERSKFNTLTLLQESCTHVHFNALRAKAPNFNTTPTL